MQMCMNWLKITAKSWLKLERVEYRHLHRWRYKAISCITTFSCTQMHLCISSNPQFPHCAAGLQSQQGSAVQNMKGHLSREPPRGKKPKPITGTSEKWLWVSDLSFLEIDVLKSCWKLLTDASPLSPVDLLLWRALLLSPCVHPTSLSFGLLGQRERRRWRRDPALLAAWGAPWRPSPSGGRPPVRWNKQWW